jgi:hypothetical protein
MYSMTKEEFEGTIKRNLQKNQWIIFASMMISLTIFIVNENNVYWSLLLLAIGSISLITINSCKSDRRHFDSGQLKSTSGVLVDLFPQDQTGNAWIVFIQETSTGKILELTVPVKPEAELQKSYHVLFTPKLNILVKMA